MIVWARCQPPLILMTNKALGIFIAGSLSLALGAYWSANHRDRTKRATGVAGLDNSSRNSSSPKTETGLASEIAALEARREKLNQTVWATELLAQQHEEVFIKLWDDLRNREDAFAVLTNFSFGELLLGVDCMRGIHDRGAGPMEMAMPLRFEDLRYPGAPCSTAALHGRQCSRRTASQHRWQGR